MKDGCWYAEPREGRAGLRMVISAFLEVPTYEVDLPDSLARTRVARGDWIVRTSATTQKKLQALEEIIRAELRRTIHFEKRTVERDTIVVTGRYAFRPLPGDDPNRLYLFANEDATEKAEADSLPQLWKDLANGMGIAIDDRTAPTTNARIAYTCDGNLLNALYSSPIDTEKDLPALLDNLAKQTGLTFTVKKQPREIWFAVEDSRS